MIKSLQGSFFLLLFLFPVLGFAQNSQVETAQKLLAARQFKKSIALCQEILQNTKEEKAVENTLQLLIRIAENSITFHASIHINSNDGIFYEHAKKAYQLYLQFKPEDPEILYHYGVILFRVKQPKNALRVLEKALYLGFDDAAKPLGDIRSAQKDFYGAISAYEIALENDPANKQLWYSLGLSLYSLQDHRYYEKALSAFERALALPKNLQSSLQKKILFYAGLVLEELDRNQEAIEFYLQSLDLYFAPNILREDVYSYLQLHTLLAGIYAEEDIPHRAIYYFNKAEKLAKQKNLEDSVASINNNLAWYLCKTQHRHYQTKNYFKDAYKRAKEAVRISRKHTGPSAYRIQAIYLDTLAEAALKSGRPLEANQYAKEAEKLAPESVYYRERAVYFSQFVLPISANDLTSSPTQ